jgi:hypothetical protein
VPLNRASGNVPDVSCVALSAVSAAPDPVCVPVRALPAFDSVIALRVGAAHARIGHGARGQLRRIERRDRRAVDRGRGAGEVRGIEGERREEARGQRRDFPGRVDDADVPGARVDAAGDVERTRAGVREREGRERGRARGAGLHADVDAVDRHAAGDGDVAGDRAAGAVERLRPEDGEVGVHLVGIGDGAVAERERDRDLCRDRGRQQQHEQRDEQAEVTVHEDLLGA